MPSKDDRTTRHQSPGVLTGHGGETLEPIIDPAVKLSSSRSAEFPDSADAVDDLLTEDGDGMLRGLEVLAPRERSAPADAQDPAASPDDARRAANAAATLRADHAALCEVLPQLPRIGITMTKGDNACMTIRRHGSDQLNRLQASQPRQQIRCIVEQQMRDGLHAQLQ